MMQIKVLATAGILALAITACNKGAPNNQTAAANGATANAAQPGLPTPPARTTGQTGAAGLQVDPAAMVSNCISPADQQRPITEISIEQRRAVVSCINAAAVRQLNSQLPRQIDSATRLDRVRSEGTLLAYEYTITRRDLPPNVAEQIEAATRRNVCGQPQMRQTLALGGSYQYRYVDADGQLVGETTVDAC